MKEQIVHCPRIDHRPVLLDACRWRYQEKAPECAGCKAWERPGQRDVVEKLIEVEWPWERKETMGDEGFGE